MNRREFCGGVAAGIIGGFAINSLASESYIQAKWEKDIIGLFSREVFPKNQVYTAVVNSRKTDGVYYCLDFLPEDKDEKSGEVWVPLCEKERDLGLSCLNVIFATTIDRNLLFFNKNVDWLNKNERSIVKMCSQQSFSLRQRKNITAIIVGDKNPIKDTVKYPVIVIPEELMENSFKTCCGTKAKEEVPLCIFVVGDSKESLKIPQKFGENKFGICSLDNKYLLIGQIEC